MTIGARIGELNKLLAGTRITALTLITSTETIMLHRHPHSPSSPGVTRHSRLSSSSLSVPWNPGSSPGVTGQAVNAPCSGTFLHRHPLRDAPLVLVGQGIQAGAVLGLLQIGPLLLSITAPHAGTVATLAPEHAVVGYGTTLVEVT